MSPVGPSETAFLVDPGSTTGFATLPDDQGNLRQVIVLGDAAGHVLAFDVVSGVPVYINGIDAIGASLTKNPLPVAGRRKSDGLVEIFNFDDNKNLYVVDQRIRPGEDSSRNRMAIEEQDNIVIVIGGNLSATNVINKACRLGRVIIGNPSTQAAVITLADAGATSFSLTTVPGTSPVSIPFGAMFNINLTVTVTNAGTGLSVAVLAS